MDRKNVCSYELFNTLLIRLDQSEIFKIMNKKLKIPDFINIRLLAQKNADGCLDSIYLQLRILLGLTFKDMLKIKNLELFIEERHIIPILSNIQMIKEGDIILTNKYLPEEFINKCIRKYITSDYNLYLYDNKDQIFSDILTKYKVDKHIGPDYYDDVIAPNKYNIWARLSNIHNYTDIEILLYNYDKYLFTFFRRYRLSNPYMNNTIEYNLYDEQIKYNIPILLFVCYELKCIVEYECLDKLLLLTRSGNLLYQLFTRLYPTIKCEIIHSGRLMNNSKDPSYKKYIESKYNDKSLIFDFSGASIFSGMKVLDNPRIHILTYNGIIKLNNITYTKKKPALFINYNIECMNNDMSGELIRLENNGRDIRAPSELNLNYIIIQQSTFINFFNRLECQLQTEYIYNTKLKSPNLSHILHDNLLLKLSYIYNLYIDDVAQPIIKAHNNVLTLRTLCYIYNYKLSIPNIQICENVIDSVCNKEKIKIVRILELRALELPHKKIRKVWDSYTNNKCTVDIFDYCDRNDYYKYDIIITDKNISTVDDVVIIKN